MVLMMASVMGVELTSSSEEDDVAADCFVRRANDSRRRSLSSITSGWSLPSSRTTKWHSDGVGRVFRRGVRSPSSLLLFSLRSVVVVVVVASDALLSKDETREGTLSAISTVRDRFLPIRGRFFGGVLDDDDDVTLLSFPSKLEQLELTTPSGITTDDFLFILALLSSSLSPLLLFFSLPFFDLPNLPNFLLADDDFPSTLDFENDDFFDLGGEEEEEEVVSHMDINFDLASSRIDSSAAISCLSLNCIIQCALSDLSRDMSISISNRPRLSCSSFLENLFFCAILFCIFFGMLP
mmetsp:Transcript_14250/g.30738  ORF Transcript_14250/g.30738 Transcript_14250/m.30738 type:complete len:295 (+) Transcript_14250:542-1426(+)